MRRRERPRTLEYLVFGIFLVLAAVLLFFGAQRFLAGRDAGRAPAPQSVSSGLKPRGNLVSGGTESAVTELPPVRLSKAGRSAAPPAAVPSPGSRKK